MKKWNLLLGLVITGTLAVTACSQPSEQVTSSEAPTVVAETAIEETETETEEESVEEESEDYFKVGETATLGDWEITLDDFEAADKVAAAYGSFNPNEGSKYVVAYITIKNNGTSSDTFAPSFNMGSSVSGKVYYQGTYEFSGTNLLGHSDDLHNKTLNPLASTSGLLAFDVAEEAAQSDELTLEFSLGRDKVTFELK